MVIAAIILIALGYGILRIARQRRNA
jgi:hypothetical protein